MCYGFFNSTVTDSILYEVGSYAKVEYTIGHSALGKPASQIRLQSEIAFKIRDMSQNVIAVEHSSTNHILREEVNSEIVLEEKIPINLLTRGTNYYQFTPQHSGYYEFVFENKSYMNVQVSDETNYDGIYIKIFKKLNEKTTYYFTVTNQDSYIESFFKVSLAANLLDIVVNVGKTNLTKVEDISGLKKVSYSHPRARIAVLDADFNVIKSNNTNECFFHFLNSQYYYIQIINNSISTINGDIEIMEIEENLSLGVNHLVNVNNGDSFVKYVPLSSGFYSFVIIESTSSDYRMKIYNENGDITSSANQVIGDGYVKYSLYLISNNEYFIGYENSLMVDGYMNITVKPQTAVFDWYVNQSKVSGNDIYFFQGESFTIQLGIGNTLISAELMNVAENQVYYSAGYWRIPYDALLIPGRILVARDSEIEGININITPVVSLEIAKGTTTVNDSNYFDWVFTSPNYHDQIIFSGRFIYTNGISRLFTVSTYAKSGRVSAPSGDGVSNPSFFSRGTTIADIHFDTIGYRQTTYINNNQVVIYRNLRNSYPSVKKARSNEFYMNPQKMHMMFDGGSGTVSSPYQVTNAWQLNNMRYILEDVRISYDESDKMMTNHYLIMNSITTATGVPFTPLPILRGSITSQGTRKKITIHTLDTKSDDRSAGFISWISGGRVANLIIEVSNELARNGNSLNRKGVIAGVMVSGIIENCLTYGSFTLPAINFRDSAFGGIVGVLSGGTVQTSTSYVDMNTYGDAGGIVGRMYDGLIYGCIYGGKSKVYYTRSSLTEFQINDNSMVGGIVGWQSNGNIDECKILAEMTITYSSSRAVGDKGLRPALGYIIGRQSGTGKIGKNYIPSDIEIYCVIDLNDSLYTFKSGGYEYKQTEFVAFNKRQIGRTG